MILVIGCTVKVGNKERYIGADMGFYFKWNISPEGLPRGCPGFKDSSTGADMTLNQFQTTTFLGPNCPKQDTDDGTGLKLWETVEEFADDQESWMKEFVSALEKMQGNGYKSLQQGPKGFWTHF